MQVVVGLFLMGGNMLAGRHEDQIARPTLQIVPHLVAVVGHNFLAVAKGTAMVRFQIFRWEIRHRRIVHKIGRNFGV